MFKAKLSHQTQFFITVWHSLTSNHRLVILKMPTQIWGIWEVRRRRSRWHHCRSLIAILCQFLQPGQLCSKISQLNSYLLLPPPLFLTGQREKEWRRGIAALSSSKLRSHSKDPIVCQQGWRWGEVADRQALQSGCWPDKQRLFGGSGEKSPSWMLVFPLCTNGHYEHLLNLQPADFLTKHPSAIRPATHWWPSVAHNERTWRIRSTCDAHWLKCQTFFLSPFVFVTYVTELFLSSSAV